MLKYGLIFLLFAGGCGKEKTKTQYVPEPFPVPTEIAPELPPARVGSLGFERFEQEIIDDLQSLPEQTRLRSVYVWNNRFNESASGFLFSITKVLDEATIKDEENFAVSTQLDGRIQLELLKKALARRNWGGTLDTALARVKDLENTLDFTRTLLQEADEIETSFFDGNLEKVVSSGSRIQLAQDMRTDAKESVRSSLADTVAAIREEIQLAFKPLQAAEMAAIQDGINFGLNMISTERDLPQATPIGTSGQIYRVDGDDYGLSKRKWFAVAERLDIPVFSQTIRGATIRALTQNATPWAYMGDLFLTTNNSPGLYYFLVEQPGRGSLPEFYAGIGTDPQGEFDDLEAACAGYTESQIALQTNRMVCVLDSDDGSAWVTYDTDSKVNAGDNLNETPFPFEARSNKELKHDANEILYTGPNGLLFKRLNGAAIAGEGGAAEDLAPFDVVANRNAAAKGLSSQIDLLSCSLCHFAGIIPVTDQIGPHIQRTPGFDANDKLRGENIFRQEKISAQYRKDNDRLKDSLGRLGISQFEKDPLNNSITDPHRLEQNLDQIAALFFLPPDEFSRRLQASPTAAVQVGNLLNGGAIGLELLKTSFNVIAQDLNLFKDRDQVNN